MNPEATSRVLQGHYSDYFPGVFYRRSRGTWNIRLPRSAPFECCRLIDMESRLCIGNPFAVRVRDFSTTFRSIPQGKMHVTRPSNDRVQESDRVDAHQAANIATPCKSNRDPLSRDFIILRSSNPRPIRGKMCHSRNGDASSSAFNIRSNYCDQFQKMEFIFVRVKEISEKRNSQ
jgi:hypothetical protein